MNLVKFSITVVIHENIYRIKSAKLILISNVLLMDMLVNGSKNYVFFLFPRFASKAYSMS